MYGFWIGMNGYEGYIYLGDIVYGFFDGVVDVV